MYSAFCSKNAGLCNSSGWLVFYQNMYLVFCDDAEPDFSNISIIHSFRLSAGCVPIACHATLAKQASANPALGGDHSRARSGAHLG